MTTRNRRRLLAALALSGGCWAALNLAQAPIATALPDPASERALHALVEQPGVRAAATVPPGFKDEFGYDPQLDNGRLVDPTGGCSTPVPLPAALESACRGHDLGYDLLRRSADHGAPVGGWARRAVDDRLGRDAHAACDLKDQGGARTGCNAWANVAVAAVRFNTWRQHDTPPGHETPLSVATGAAGGIAVVSLLGIGGVGVTGLGRRARRSLNHVGPAGVSAVAS